MVDYLEDSPTLREFQSRKIDDPRYRVACANLVELRSYYMTSWYIVNASNPKFSEGGTGTNRAIHDSCRSEYTPSLQTLTRKCFGDSATVAKAYPVELPRGCPLRENQNVRYVIHVVGPNMNPKKAHYLGDSAESLENGKNLLRQSYSDVLQAFWRLTQLKD